MEKEKGPYTLRSKCPWGTNLVVAQDSST